MLNFITRVVANEEFSLGCLARSVIGKQYNDCAHFLNFPADKEKRGNRELLDISLSI